MSSHDRLLSVLALFDEEKPSWSADEMISFLGLTRSTTYRYIKTLCDFEFLESIGKDRYILGTRFIVMDRVIRSCDPVLHIAEPEIRWLVERTGHTVTLTKLFRGQMVRIFLAVGRNQVEVGYDRGQLLPLFKGCTGKIILAHLPWRQLKSLYGKKQKEILDLGMGEDWNTFLQHVRRFAKNDSLCTAGEILAGNMGIAAPLFGNGRNVLGSITLIMKEEATATNDIAWMTENVEQVANRISERLSSMQELSNEQQTPLRKLTESGVVR